jgi:hypothetical protein
VTNYSDPLDYNDFDAIVERARMQRSIAVGNAIASLVTAILSGLTRAVDAIKSGTRGSKSSAAADAGPILDASGHR